MSAQEILVGIKTGGKMKFELDQCRHSPCSSIMYDRGQTHYKCIILDYIVDDPNTIPDDCPFWEYKAYEEETDEV